MQANVNLDALLEKMKDELKRAGNFTQTIDFTEELRKIQNCLDAILERET